MEEGEKIQIKARIRKRVYAFFIESSDFNGIPLRKICRGSKVAYSECIDLIKELATEGIISIQSSTNPHIIGFSHYTPEDQCRVLEEAKGMRTQKQTFGTTTIESEETEFPICLYPSTKYLEENRDISAFGNAVYTRKLALGSPQLKFVYLEIEVLDKYADDGK